MIRVKVKEYLNNKEKYDKYPDKYKTVKHESNKYLIRFSINYLPETLDVYQGEEIVIPTFMSGKEAKDIYKNTKSMYELMADSYVVEIDDTQEIIPKSQKLMKGTYIDIDDLIVSDKQHWLNRKVIEYYKHLDSIVLSTDVKKAKEIFKALSKPDNKALNYSRIITLFNITGQSDELFKKFVLGGKK